MTKFLKLEEKYELNAVSIDQISEKSNDIFQSLKMRRDDSMRLRLSIEESLLTWLNKIGEGNEITIKSDMVFFRPTLRISCKADRVVNPYADEEVDAISKNMLNNLMSSPDYSYEKGSNVLTFKLKKPKINPIITSLTVIIVSIIIGVIGLYALPTTFVETVMSNIIDPIYSKFLDVLRCIAGPLIFFSVAWGIYGIGDAATLNKIGKKMVIRMVGTTMLASIICVPFFWVFNSGITEGRTDWSSLSSIFAMFLEMIPSTIVEPFSNGNTMQIIVMSVVVGIALLYLGKRTTSVAIIIDQLNIIINFVMEFISKLVPYFISIVLISLIWSGSLNVVTDSWLFFVTDVGMCLLFGLLMFIYTSINVKVKPNVLLKKAMPAYFVALTTASSSATFGPMIKTCESGFGINTFFTRFGIPLGIIMQKPSTAINNILVVFYLASSFGVNCSISWIVMCVIVSAIIAIATPPIPGGGTIAYTALFLQMGIPLEGLAIALSLDMLTDFVMTSSDMFSIQINLINLANKFKMIKKETLVENKKVVL